MIRIEFDESEKQAIAYDTDEKIGECDYEDVGEKWNITHTSVNEYYQGQGVAKKLVECVIENANKQRKIIVADCGYAKKILQKSEEKKKMCGIKVGMLFIVLAWLIPTLSMICDWSNLLAEMTLLNSGYEVTQAEIRLDEADFDEVYGYQALTLKYIANDEIIEKKIDRKEYNGALIHGGLMKIMYNENDVQDIRYIANENIISNTISFLINTSLLIYIMKKFYPEMVSRIKQEYKGNEYVDAKIISCDYYNRLVAIDDANIDEKIRIYKSFPYFNDKSNMKVFLQSKNIDKIRVYFDKNNNRKIVMDYKIMEEVNGNDK